MLWINTSILCEMQYERGQSKSVALRSLRARELDTLALSIYIYVCVYANVTSILYGQSASVDLRACSDWLDIA